eukprot:Gb_41106 [translate_table: standard]
MLPTNDRVCLNTLVHSECNAFTLGLLGVEVNLAQRFKGVTMFGQRSFDSSLSYVLRLRVIHQTFQIELSPLEVRMMLHEVDANDGRRLAGALEDALDLSRWLEGLYTSYYSMTTTNGGKL